jgi:stalled ribosome rescue protein Dom34
MIVGTVEGARHDPTSVLVARASELLGHVAQQRQAEGVDTALAEAAKTRRAVTGLDETVDAVNRGSVQRLYVAKSFTSSGQACGGCGALARGAGAQCRLCGAATTPEELAEAMSDRVLAAGGRVDVVDSHAQLDRVGGVAALLRYPL